MKRTWNYHLCICFAVTDVVAAVVTAFWMKMPGNNYVNHSPISYRRHLTAPKSCRFIWLGTGVYLTVVPVHCIEFICSNFPVTYEKKGLLFLEWSYSLIKFVIVLLGYVSSCQLVDVSQNEKASSLFFFLSVCCFPRIFWWNDHNFYFDYNG